MTRAANANVSALVALVLAVPMALGIVLAWAPLRDSFPSPEPEPEVPLKPRPKGQPKANPKAKAKEPPAPKVPAKLPDKEVSKRPVLPPEPEVAPRDLVREFALGAAEGVDDVYVAPPPRAFVAHFMRPPLAREGCAKIAQAIDAYVASERNPGVTPLERFPTVERDLFEPPFGGQSFLPHGRRDLTDPWGQPYQFHFVTRADGTVSALVYTHAPDGEYINQHGIGEKAIP